jgi:RNA-directed DNA polymerase
MSIEPPNSPNIDALPNEIAAFLVAEAASGRTLGSNALLARARRYFVGCDALIRAVCRAELNLHSAAHQRLVALVRASPEYAHLERIQHEPSFDAELDELTWQDDDMLDDADREAIEALEALIAEGIGATPGIKDPVALQRLCNPPNYRSHINPSITTPTELAQRLEVSLEELDALLHHCQRHTPYHLLLRPKKSGGWRLIEQPTDGLRVVQRRILRHVLASAPLHDAAHGFVRGRSIFTHAEAHVGKRVVVRLDISNFFTSISAGRVHSAFLRLGLPPCVATPLTALTTAAQSPRRLREAFKAHRETLGLSAANEWILAHQETLCSPHPPQGAPSSPMLANWIAHRLDQRLAGLAAAWRMSYSRYADDLTFSSDEPTLNQMRFVDTVRDIVASEGWVLNARKTLVMPQSNRQRVTGLVVNQSLNLCRKDYDALKAAVHRCVTSTTLDDAQRAQLFGRIAWLGQLRPERAAKLRAKLLG